MQTPHLSLLHRLHADIEAITASGKRPRHIVGTSAAGASTTYLTSGSRSLLDLGQFFGRHKRRCEKAADALAATAQAARAIPALAGAADVEKACADLERIANEARENHRLIRVSQVRAGLVTISKAFAQWKKPAPSDAPPPLGPPLPNDLPPPLGPPPPNDLPPPLGPPPPNDLPPPLGPPPPNDLPPPLGPPPPNDLPPPLGPPPPNDLPPPLPQPGLPANVREGSAVAPPPSQVAPPPPRPKVAPGFALDRWLDPKLKTALDVEVGDRQRAMTRLAKELAAMIAPPFQALTRAKAFDLLVSGEQAFKEGLWDLLPARFAQLPEADQQLFLQQVFLEMCLTLPDHQIDDRTIFVNGKRFERSSASIGQPSKGSIEVYACGDERLIVKHSAAFIDGFRYPDDDIPIAELLHEARIHQAAMAGGHPNIVALHGVLRTREGGAMLVMEFAQKGDANSLLQKLSALEILANAGQYLASVHQEPSKTARLRIVGHCKRELDSLASRSEIAQLRASHSGHDVQARLFQRIAEFARDPMQFDASHEDDLQEIALAAAEANQSVQAIRAQVARGMLQATEHMHTHGNVLHLDIKPVNFFIDANFQPKLGDFGTGKSGTEVILKKAPVDNLQWHSPTVAAVKARADRHEDALRLARRRIAKMPAPRPSGDHALRRAKPDPSGESMSAANDHWGVAASIYQVYKDRLPLKANAFGGISETEIHEFRKLADEQRRATALELDLNSETGRAITEMLDPDRTMRRQPKEVLQKEVFKDREIGAESAAALWQLLEHPERSPLGALFLAPQRTDATENSQPAVTREGSDGPIRTVRIERRSV